jgi:hypothetical protein
MAFATCNSGGDDPPPPPIEINDLAGLNAISASAASLSGNYKLTADIVGVTDPIGRLSGSLPVAFTGNFDGNGYTVTLNITSGLAVPSFGTYAGLFAIVDTGGLVHDLTVTGTITIPGATTAVYAGGVAGVMLSTATVSKVASSVSVSAVGSGDVYAGGIAGVSQSAVSNVYATGNISATSSGNNREVYAGGIVGASQGTVSYAYATGAITAVGATGGGTNPENENPFTVGAGGIAGAATGAPVRYTVALNSGVSASGTNYNKCSYRIASTSSGTVPGGPNYGRTSLIPTVSGIGGTSHTGGGTGANQEDGLDVTVTGGPVYTAPIETWWKNTGFSGANWTTVWEWDAATGLPKLR